MRLVRHGEKMPSSRPAGGDDLARKMPAGGAVMVER